MRPRCPHWSMSDAPCQDALGSNAEAMGGIAGRVDALFGAVEAQKTTGGLHYHFFMYAQRLHQFAILKEMDEKIESGLVHSPDLKPFLCQLCCEKCPDVRKFDSERNTLEKNFPRYAESTECIGTPTWGEL